MNGCRYIPGPWFTSQLNPIAVFGGKIKNPAFSRKLFLATRIQAHFKRQINPIDSCRTSRGVDKNGRKKCGRFEYFSYSWMHAGAHIRSDGFDICRLFTRAAEKVNLAVKTMYFHQGRLNTPLLSPQHPTFTNQPQISRSTTTASSAPGTTSSVPTSRRSIRRPSFATSSARLIASTPPNTGTGT